jgi:hypothetical protein
MRQGNPQGDYPYFQFAVCSFAALSSINISWHGSQDLSLSSQAEQRRGFYSKAIGWT